MNRLFHLPRVAGGYSGVHNSLVGEFQALDGGLQPQVDPVFELFFGVVVALAVELLPFIGGSEQIVQLADEEFGVDD